MADGRKLRQQEFQEKRELLEFTESQLNQLTYEMKEEIRQYSEEVERKVRWLLMLLDSLILVSSSWGRLFWVDLMKWVSNVHQSVCTVDFR